MREGAAADPGPVEYMDAGIMGRAGIAYAVFTSYKKREKWEIGAKTALLGGLRRVAGPSRSIPLNVAEIIMDKALLRWRPSESPESSSG